MSVAVSQDLVRSLNVAEVISGRQTKAIRAVGSATDKPATTPVLELRGSGVKSSEAALVMLESAREQMHGQSSYDRPAARTQKALDTYQSLATARQREEIQQYFSVDLFA